MNLRKKAKQSVLLVLVMTFSLFSAVIPAAVETTQDMIGEVLNSIANSYTNISNDEWKVVELVALGKTSNINKSDFIEFLKTQIATPNSGYHKDVKSIEKAIIALSALGMDARYFPMADGATFDFVESMANFKNSGGEYSLIDTVGLAFALTAYDSGEYPDCGHFTREIIIAQMLDEQNDNGYWEFGGSANVDASSMIAAALVPYYYTNTNAKTAIDKYIVWLSGVQNEDGTFKSAADSNCNSTSLAIVALSAIGIDADTDARFVKNGNSAIDGLLSFRTSDNKFGYLNNVTVNSMATEQAFRALISYTKYKSMGFGYNIYKFGKVDRTSSKEKTVTFRIEGVSDNIIYEKNVKITTDSEKVLTLSDALMQFLNKNSIPFVQNEGYFSSINGESEKRFGGFDGWLYQVNGTNSSVGMSDYIVKDNDNIVVYYGTLDTAYPIIKSTQTSTNIEIKITAFVYNELWELVEQPVVGAIVKLSDKVSEFTALTDKDGVAAIPLTNLVKGQTYNLEVSKTDDYGMPLIVRLANDETITVTGGSVVNNDVTVSVEVIGDTAKGTILQKTNVTVPNNSSAWTAIKKILDSKGISYSNPTGNYIKAIDGLAEFDKGEKSGWVFYVGSSQPSESVADYIIKSGDVIKLKYTIDYNDNIPSGNGGGGGFTKPAEINMTKSLEKLAKKETLSEWDIFVLAKNGIKVDSKHFEAIESDLKEKGGVYRIPTDYAKLAIALKASGKSIKNFAGYNLLEKICNNEELGKQGVNGYVFSLIALGGESLSDNYLWSREKIIDKIIGYQKSDGGFCLSLGTVSDVDITAMALSALAPYKDDENIKIIIDKGLDFLKKSQNKDGTFLSNGEKSSESISQVIIALSTLGIDARSSDFIKNGKSLLDVLTTFKLSDETFAHTVGGKSNDIATNQVLTALTAYNLYSKNGSTIYDFDVEQTSSRFDDILDYPWAEKEINSLTEKGIINGVSSTSFAPDMQITRADYMCLLVRMLNLEADVSDNFIDVERDKYYYNEIGIAKALGLTTGTGDNKFNPEEKISRQDMFVLAYRIIKLQNIDLDSANEAVINNFDDYNKISDYAKDAVAVLVKNNLVKGDDNKLNPIGNATRAETAVFIYRLYEIMYN